MAQLFFHRHFKTKIIFNSVKFVATLKGMTTNFFHPSLLVMFLDPGSGMGKNQDLQETFEFCDNFETKIILG